MRRHLFGAITACLLVCALAVGCTPSLSPPPPKQDDGRVQKTATSDRFGVPYLYPTAPGGMSWESSWDHGLSDEWFHTGYGNGEYETQDGELRISGASPRMYVYNPDLMRQWRDVEITVYFQRVSDAKVPYAGMTAVTRSNHGVTGDETQDLCDTRGYGARVRFDGQIDFEKETSHPRNKTYGTKELFADGMPYNTWMGYKFVVHDIDKKHVKLELWIDRNADGKWVKVNEMVDDGTKFGKVPCAEGINPKAVLNNTGTRKGSESGKPNITTYFRSDGISTNGLIYKWASVREID